MLTAIEKRREKLPFKILSSFIAFTFAFSIITPPGYAQTVMPSVLNLPPAGAMVPVTAGFTPPLIKGLTVKPENPMAFDFIIGRGDDNLKGPEFEAESKNLIKYFLAALTVPEEDMWVNLSPYEKDRIIPKGFDDTVMGRDLLAQDYLLKQLTASLMYPEDEVGQKFWDRVYKKAYEKYGTTEIPMNTFNKIWIVPQEAVVYEHETSAFVIKSHLKVMLEEDYVALQENLGVKKYGLDSMTQDDAKILSGVSSEVVREVLIPEIEKEINEGKTFAQLRQIYNSVILASWYKDNLKESLLGQIYVDKAKTKGVDTEDKEINQKIYDQYVAAFKKGVYNYIREDYDPHKQKLIPRKYFSGGIGLIMTHVNVDGVRKSIKDILDKTQRPDLASDDNARVSTEFVEIPEDGNAKIVQEEVKRIIRETSELAAAASPAIAVGRESSSYGPHISQNGLQPLFERIAWARKHAPDSLKIKDIVAFEDQKHGMDTKDALSFAVVLEDDIHINQNASVMGGISAGVNEPGTHASIKEAITFFNENVRSKLIGLNISQPNQITQKLIEIDEEFRAKAEKKDKPRFSYIGSEISVGVSMMGTIALAEALNVPLPVAINYRYNEYVVTHGLANKVRPMSIPVNYSVVWEGGKHGVAKYLDELVEEGIITDVSRFPKKFTSRKLMDMKDKSILLAMVPPQELQIMVFAPTWNQAREIGIKLTQAYKKLLKKNGIKTKYGAESGFTTEQVHTEDGRLITLELALDILDQAVDSLDPQEAKYVRYALDLAASEMYLSEIDMYYIGPDAAASIPDISEQSKKDGLVTNAEFTQYKLGLLKKYKRFFSVEDWADENKPEHWKDARAIMDTHIQMGDDFDVSNAYWIRKYADLQNAHLQKPNQSGEEEVAIEAVATSHQLGNVVVASHRGTRSAQETYTAQFAIGAGLFGDKWTLWGPGRGALIAAMTHMDVILNQTTGEDVTIPYQGALVLDPNGPYQDAGWAKRTREEIIMDGAINNVLIIRNLNDYSRNKTIVEIIKDSQKSKADSEQLALRLSAEFVAQDVGMPDYIAKKIFKEVAAERIRLEREATATSPLTVKKVEDILAKVSVDNVETAKTQLRNEATLDVLLITLGPILSRLAGTQEDVKVLDGATRKKLEAQFKLLASVIKPKKNDVLTLDPDSIDLVLLYNQLEIVMDRGGDLSTGIYPGMVKEYIKLIKTIAKRSGASPAVSPEEEAYTRSSEARTEERLQPVYSVLQDLFGGDPATQSFVSTYGSIADQPLPLVDYKNGLSRSSEKEIGYSRTKESSRYTVIGVPTDKGPVEVTLVMAIPRSESAKYVTKMPKEGLPADKQYLPRVLADKFYEIDKNIVIASVNESKRISGEKYMVINRDLIKIIPGENGEMDLLTMIMFYDEGAESEGRPAIAGEEGKYPLITGSLQEPSHNFQAIVDVTDTFNIGVNGSGTISKPYVWARLRNHHLGGGRVVAVNGVDTKEELRDYLVNTDSVHGQFLREGEYVELGPNKNDPGYDGEYVIVHLKDKEPQKIYGFNYRYELGKPIPIKRSDFDKAGLSGEAVFQTLSENNLIMIKKDKEDVADLNESLDEIKTKLDDLFVTTSDDVWSILYKSQLPWPWQEYGVDMVVDTTGQIKSAEGLEYHRKSMGYEKEDKSGGYVILSVPSKKDKYGKTTIPGVLMGAGQDVPESNLISNWSCSTNCNTHIQRGTRQKYRVNATYVGIAHSLTRSASGKMMDSRKGMSVYENMIPGSTGLSIAMIPALQASGIEVNPESVGADSTRLPVPDGSLGENFFLMKSTDLEGEKVTAEGFNEYLEEQAQGSMKNTLKVVDTQPSSRQIIGEDVTTVVPADRTHVIDLGNGYSLVRVAGWFDNVWGYTQRLDDLSQKVWAAKQLEREGITQDKRGTEEYKKAINEIALRNIKSGLLEAWQLNEYMKGDFSPEVKKAAKAASSAAVKKEEVPIPKDLPIDVEAAKKRAAETLSKPAVVKKSKDEIAAEESGKKIAAVPGKVDALIAKGAEKEGLLLYPTEEQLRQIQEEFGKDFMLKTQIGHETVSQILTTGITRTRPGGQATMVAIVLPKAASSAVKNQGGINLNRAGINFQVIRDADGIPLPVSQQPIENIRIDGVLPFIIQIVPVNLPMLLGFADDEDLLKSAEAASQSDTENPGGDLSFFDKYRNKFLREQSEDSEDLPSVLN